MTEAELTYRVTQAAWHQADVEKIFAAIGAYENELPYQTVQTAMIDEPTPDTVVLTYVQTIKDDVHGTPAWVAANKIRPQIEKHFSAEDRTRLSKYFLRLAIK